MIVPFNNYTQIASLKGTTGMGLLIRVLDVGAQINVGTNKVELDAGVDSNGNLANGLPIKDTDGIVPIAPFADTLYGRAKGTGVNRGVNIEVVVYKRT